MPLIAYMPQLRINVRVIASCHMKCSKYRQFFFLGRCIYRQWRLLPWCCFKRKAVEDRTATNRKLSEQQQARCEGWAAATRDILEAHPGASMREYRNPRRLPASRQMWRQGQAVLPLHQRVRVSLQAYSPTCVAATRWKRSIGTQRH